MSDAKRVREVVSDMTTLGPQQPLRRTRSRTAQGAALSDGDARQQIAPISCPTKIGSALQRLGGAHAAAFIFERTLYLTTWSFLPYPYMLFVMDKSETDLEWIAEEMCWGQRPLYACPTNVGFQVIEYLRKKLQLFLWIRWKFTTDPAALELPAPLMVSYFGIALWVSLRLVIWAYQS
jgi:hypothetical protein